MEVCGADSVVPFSLDCCSPAALALEIRSAGFVSLAACVDESGDVPDLNGLTADGLSCCTLESDPFGGLDTFEAGASGDAPGLDEPGLEAGNPSAVLDLVIVG